MKFVKKILILVTLTIFSSFSYAEQENVTLYDDNFNLGSSNFANSRINPFQLSYISLQLGSFSKDFPIYNRVTKDNQDKKSKFSHGSIGFFAPLYGKFLLAGIDASFLSGSYEVKDSVDFTSMKSTDLKENYSAKIPVFVSIDVHAVIKPTFSVDLGAIGHLGIYAKGGLGAVFLPLDLSKATSFRSGYSLIYGAGIEYYFSEWLGFSANFTKKTYSISAKKQKSKDSDFSLLEGEVKESYKYDSGNIISLGVNITF